MLDKTRILIVEDEDAIRGPYKTSLERRGYNVDEATNLDTAIERINVITYHVAIVDLMLAGPGVPNLDGLEVLKQLRILNEGTKSIVLSTQKDAQVSADTVQEYSAFRYVKKEIISREGLGKPRLSRFLLLQFLPKKTNGLRH